VKVLDRAHAKMSSIDDVPSRSSLSIDVADDGGGDAFDNCPADDSTSLRTKILEIVKDSPNHIIRPSTLSQKLGISLNDANAELCGLLQAVGEGSSFQFETVGNVKVMVFEFPPDFERRALRQQRKNDWMLTLRYFGGIFIKAVKVLTAFGLILSILIVSIAGMVALMAAFVALARDSGGGNSRATRTHLTRQMHNLIITIRQLLWCYAVFGPMGETNDQDPFFREAAYDTWLVLSLCCGNPGSLFFWWRASHLRHRQHRYARGWRSAYGRGYEDSSSELEGVSLVQRNRWTGEEHQVAVPSLVSIEEHRGLLSSLVEFLFGPTTSPGPSEADKWRLRAAVIIDKASSNNENRGISLQELAPFSDSPPSSLEDKFRIMKEGLSVVAHFNGVPSVNPCQTKDDSNWKVFFDFPELISEGSGGVFYDDPRIWEQTLASSDDLNRWKNFFYSRDSSSTLRTAHASTRPAFLYERPRSFSLLTRNQFFRCLLIVILNFVGVIWFAQTVEPGGLLHDYLNLALKSALRSGLIPVLWFYARFFLLIPFSRTIFLLLWNKQCQRRNRKRFELAQALSS
jgi:hypothetical protein